MSTNSYPTLLNKKATMLASLTRIDLTVVGGCYLVLSRLKISGLYSLVIILLILSLMRFIRKYIKVGYLKHIADSRRLCWGFKLRGLYE